MITSGQIKAARALVGLTAARLAEISGIGFTTIIRLESFEGVPAGNVKTLEAVQSALEKAGIEFIGTPDSGAGVRWKV
ncbi:transcriptional regulator [Polynucleobacter paneuropaeus]|nr:transcriptional regulator [Polynucleobacter paneuropaeus]